MRNPKYLLILLVINMGMLNSINGAIKIGWAKGKDNLNELEKLLSKEDRKHAALPKQIG
jgi:hypothetical protein